MVLVLNHSFHNLLMLFLTLQTHVLFGLQLREHLFDKILLITAHLLHYFPRRPHVYLFRLLPLHKTIYFIKQVFQLSGRQLAFSVELYFWAITVKRRLCLLSLKRPLESHNVIF